LVQAYNPALYFDTPIDFFVGDNKLNCLAKETFIFRFNKGTAAAYIYNQAPVVFFFITFENHRPNIGYPGIFTWVPDSVNAALQYALFLGINHD